MPRSHFNMAEVDRFDSKYLLGKAFFEGHMNAVAVGINRHTKKRVVVKSTYKPRQDFKSKEADILKKLRHVPGVVDYLDHYYIKTDVHFLVLKHFGGHTLKRFLAENGSISEQHTHKVIRQIVTAVHHCLQLNILHKQIKPNNILIDIKTLQVKITNFGNACYFDPDGFNSQTNKLCSKVAPPEYYTLNHYTGDGLNVWSIGLLLYNLLFNRSLFNSMIDTVCQTCYIPRKKNVSLDVKLFILWTLEKSLSERMTFNEMIHHSWITKKWL